MASARAANTGSGAAVGDILAEPSRSHHRRAALSVHDPRPGQHLLPGTRFGGEVDGSEGPEDTLSRAPGERLLRATHRDHPEGMPRFPDPVQRKAFAGNPEGVGYPLQVRFILPHLAMWLKNRVHSVQKLVLQGFDCCLERVRGTGRQPLFLSRVD